MKLNKRYPRSIRSYLSFYVSASVLTMVTLLLFFLFLSEFLLGSLVLSADRIAHAIGRKQAQQFLLDSHALQYSFALFFPALSVMPLVRTDVPAAGGAESQSGISRK